MGVPQTLPADFQGWDKASASPPQTLPADFNQWDQTDSAASRLGTNFLSGAGVVSNEQGKQFFLHPLDTIIKSFESQGELAKKARDAYNRGDYAGAVQHALNYMVPFVGQQTDQAGEQLKQGDIAGGIGRTLGAAVPIVAASPEVQAGAGSAARAVGSAAKETAAVVREAATPENVATAVGGAVGGKLGAIAGSPLGGAAMGGAVGRAIGKAVAKRIAARAAAEETPDAVAESASAAPEASSKSVTETPSEPAPESTAEPAPSVDTSPKAVESKLQEALGAKPLQRNVPIRQQATASPPEASSGLPKGFTAVDSSAIKGYKYNPDAQELETIDAKTGTHYIHGDVSPEDFGKFAEAESKGKAWNQLKANSPLVGKVVNGKRVSVVIGQAKAAD